MLNIFLGFACNLNCSYCLQAGEEDRNGSPRLRTAEFLEKVVPIMKAKNIRRVAYWGGEPVLYWRHIHDIHEGFLRAGIEFDFVKITTNGTLVEREHVLDINRWRAFVNVSRHKKFGVPNWDAIRGIFRQSHSIVVTSSEYILWDFLDEIRELEVVTNRRIYPWMNWVHATKGCPESEYLTMDMARAHIDHLMELADNLVHSDDRLIGDLFYGHISKWRNQLAKKQFIPNCFGDHQIDVDLEGNRYGCHHNVNASTKLGTWEGPVEHQAAHDFIHRFVNTEECKACPIRFWCRGNCHMSQTHEVDCYLAKRKHEVFTYLDKNWTTQNERSLDYVSM